MPYRFAFIAGLLVMTMPGCLYHGGYPNNGYNYGAGPSVLQPQPWSGYPANGGYPAGSYPSGPTYTPGAPYNQPSAPLYPPNSSPTPLNGGGGTFNPTDPYSTPNSQPDSNSPPGTYDNNAPGFNTTPNKTVPNPDDIPQSSNGTTLTPTSGARSSEMESPFQQDETRRERNFEHQEVAEEESPFESPLKRTSAEEEEGDVQYANRETLSSPEAPKVYGYDPKFQWVQGVVDFDEPSGTWVIMYNNNPSASDEFGGELALGKHRKLNTLKPGDKVRIEGSFDPDQKDSRGLNLYQPSRITKQ